MGSVITYDEKCPECKKNTGMSDFYYKTGEEYFNCSNCGLAYSYEFKRDEDGQLVTRDGSDKINWDNLIMVEKINKNGKTTVKELTNENSTSNVQDKD
jgi:hypothetical protein